MHEILRQPLPNNILRSVSRHETEDKVLDANSTTVRFLRFTHLNFGLDVIPNFALKVPDSICVKLQVIVPYVVFMGLWFPFLPFIQ